MRQVSVAVLVAASLVLGCAKHEERAPATCVGDCGLAPGLGTGLPSNPGGSAGDKGEGGSDAGVSSGVELTGNVRVLNDDLDLDTSSLLIGAVDLKTDGQNGKSVTGHWNGADPFKLSNVPPSTGAWVLATPQSPVADDALPAVDAVRTDVTDSSGTVTLSLYLVHATSLDHVFALATIPLTRDASKAQIILRFTSKSSASAAPISGLNITAGSAEDVLYGASSSFSDVATETDNTGVAVLANVPGAAWPGALITVQLAGAKTAGAQVRAVSGAVTIASLVL